MKIVITTIAYPTDAVKRWAKLFPGDVIVVGDRKTPKDWQLDGVTYIPYEGPQPLSPDDNYAKKNAGYLAVPKDEAIFETDDDNAPIQDDIVNQLREYERIMLSPVGPDVYVESDLLDRNLWCNAYKFFGHGIWPRGLPPTYAHVTTGLKEDSIKMPPVVSFLVNGNPDVDAVWRIAYGNARLPYTFNKRALPVALAHHYCPFNTQATLWAPQMRALTYIPAYTQWRTNDIIKSFVAQRVLREFGFPVMFANPNVFQVRNEHNLTWDLQQEMDLVTLADVMIQRLEGTRLCGRTIPQMVMRCYESLLGYGINDDAELSRCGRFMERIK